MRNEDRTPKVMPTCVWVVQLKNVQGKDEVSIRAWIRASGGSSHCLFEEPIRQSGGRERNFDVLVAVRAFSTSVGCPEALFRVLLLRRCGRSRERAARPSRSDIQSSRDLNEALRALRAYSAHDIPEPETVKLQLK